MNVNKMILATVGGGVTAFVLGWLLYGMALADFFQANQGSASGVMKDPPEMWALIVGNLGHALLLAYVFARWAGVSTFGGGLKAGAVLGLLMALGFDFIMLGTTNLMNLTACIADLVVFTVLMGLTGGVVGLILGSGKKE